MKNLLKHSLSAFAILLFLFLAVASNSKKSKKTLAADEQICAVCYKKFKKAEGWCYNTSGTGTQNCSGSKGFCSFYCASERGKENTPKSWQKQYN
jgi:hypothetical protein